MKPSVWLLVDSLTYGGIESHVLELAKGLSAFDVQATVVLTTQYDTQAEIVPRLESQELPYAYLHELGSSLRAAVNEYRPQVVHTHGYKASLMAKALLQWLPVKIISTFHAGETPSGRVRFYDFIDRYSAFLSHQNLCVSDKIRAKLPFRSEHIRNFIQVPDTPSSIPSKHYGFVGRLSHEKGPDRFIELALRHPQHGFHIYGDGPMRQELQSKAPSNVHFEGFQSNMDAVYAKLELLVITSRFEGLPMTALEAMAREIPVLSLNVGGIPGLIESGVNGFVADSLDALSADLTRYQALSDAERYAMGSAAKQTIIQRHSYDAVIPELLKYYQLPPSSLSSTI